MRQQLRRWPLAATGRAGTIGCRGLPVFDQSVIREPQAAVAEGDQARRGIGRQITNRAPQGTAHVAHDAAFAALPILRIEEGFDHGFNRVVATVLGPVSAGPLVPELLSGAALSPMVPNHADQVHAAFMGSALALGLIGEMKHKLGILASA